MDMNKIIKAKAVICPNCNIKKCTSCPVNIMTTEYVTIETHYAWQSDITFITQDRYVGGEIIKQTVIGFYYGKPNEKDTQYYKGRLSATFKED